MTLHGSILLGSFLIATSVFAHLGYTLHRDYVAAEAIRLTRDQEQRNALAEYRRSQGKAAWDIAIRHLDWELERWLESEAKVADLDIPWVTIKAYSHPDIVWIDSRHVQANGYIHAEKGKVEQWFAWQRNLFLTDGGEWTDTSAHAKFGPSNPTEDQMKDWLVQAIRFPK